MNKVIRIEETRDLRIVLNKELLTFMFDSIGDFYSITKEKLFFKKSDNLTDSLMWENVNGVIVTTNYIDAYVLNQIKESLNINDFRIVSVSKVKNLKLDQYTYDLSIVIPLFENE